MRDSQLLFYVLKSLTLVSILEDRYTMTFYSSELDFGVYSSFKMSYSMNFYLNWLKNYKRSNLKLSDLLYRKHAFNFDLS